MDLQRTRVTEKHGDLIQTVADVSRIGSNAGGPALCHCDLARATIDPETKLLIPVIASSQSVSERTGCISFKTKNGVEKEITDSQRDSQPSLSFDGRLIVFVRCRPGHAIVTGLPAMEDENELWFANGATKFLSRNWRLT